VNAANNYATAKCKQMKYSKI